MQTRKGIGVLSPGGPDWGQHPGRTDLREQWSEQAVWRPVPLESIVMEILEKLELSLGYEFDNPALLNKALIHSSHAHEQNTGEDNEQLEFLGDAVLGLLVSDLLFRSHPNLTEGELSKLKGFFVSAANLVK